jgi:hypothetical protein
LEGRQLKPVGDPEQVKVHLADEVATLLSALRNILGLEVRELGTNLHTLRQVRSHAYEDTNQILHEALLLRAIDYLQPKYTQPIEWFWNPRQTGDSNEPDLQGFNSADVLVSAEATTSDEPQAAVDKRMKRTLRKLSSMKGDLYYFVETEAMQKRAQTKVSRANYQITVVVIAGHQRAGA